MLRKTLSSRHKNQPLCLYSLDVSVSVKLDTMNMWLNPPLGLKSEFRSEHLLHNGRQFANSCLQRRCSRE